MRQRAMLAWTAFGLALLLAVLADPTGVAWLSVAAGALAFVALGLALSLLPLWSRLPRLHPMPGLFSPTGAGRWCTACGRPAPRGAACPGCAAKHASPGAGAGKARPRKTKP
ncbi:MAG TPA: hypothetical protein VFH47_00635 [Candidatus Thermoplasmatota archaeon]|nr:hypothetical protein [Candidatus Thermoplasmatota archaeon]